MLATVPRMSWRGPEPRDEAHLQPSTPGEAEWRLRVDLVACDRLVALYGPSDLIFTPISAKLPTSQREDHVLPHRFGKLFDAITASSLTRIDRDGNPLSASTLPVNRVGLVIHITVHGARLDVGCVRHSRTCAGVTVSAQRQGLRALLQDATRVAGSLACWW